jgi:hypothetical protein
MNPEFDITQRYGNHTYKIYSLCKLRGVLYNQGVKISWFDIISCKSKNMQSRTVERGGPRALES